jgi:hypothetical protein
MVEESGCFLIHITALICLDIHHCSIDVTTRGKYYPDKSLATEKDPPLYLHITAASQESLDEAVKKIEEMMEQSYNNAPTQATRHGAAQHSGGVREIICYLFIIFCTMF